MRRPYLRQSACLAGVFQMDLYTFEFPFKRFEQIDISPAKRRCMEHYSGSSVKYSGDDDPDPVASRSVANICKRPADLGPEVADKLLRIETRRKADDFSHLLADRIGDHHECSRCTNVNRDGQALLR